MESTTAEAILSGGFALWKLLLNKDLPTKFTWPSQAFNIRLTIVC
jgi:hypothetical protein